MEPTRRDLDPRSQFTTIRPNSNTELKTITLKTDACKSSLAFLDLAETPPLEVCRVKRVPSDPAPLSPPTWGKPRFLQIAELFDKAKDQGKTGLQVFFDGFPTVELHIHPIPSVEDILRYAEINNLYFHSQKKIFQSKPSKHKKNTTQAKELQLQTNSTALSIFYESITIKKTDPPLKKIADFHNIFPIVDSAKVPPMVVIKSAIDQARAEHIRYLELLYDFYRHTSIPSGYSLPRADREAMEKQMELLFDQLTEWRNGFVNYWESELKLLEEMIMKLENSESSIFDVDHDITARLIFEVMRTPSSGCKSTDLLLLDFFVDIMAGLALATKVPGKVAGINVVGPEHLPIAIECRTQQMWIISFLAKKFNNFKNISIHAGELTETLVDSKHFAPSIMEPCNIVHSLPRIGHGACITKIGQENIRAFKDKRIMVEVCLGSNKQLLNIKGRAHPVHHFRKEGIPFCLATDDPRVFKITQQSELIRYIKHTPDVTFNEIVKIERTALHYSFFGGQDAPSIYDSETFSIKPEFNRPINTSTPIKELDFHEKIQLQISYERKLNEFILRTIKTSMTSTQQASSY